MSIMMQSISAASFEHRRLVASKSPFTTPSRKPTTVGPICSMKLPLRTEERRDTTAVLPLLSIEERAVGNDIVLVLVLVLRLMNVDG